MMASVGLGGITRSRVPAGLNCWYHLQQPDWFRPPRSSSAGPARATPRLIARRAAV
jgi:hypothetical protein